MALLSSFNDRVNAEVPGAPDTLVDREISRTVADFFRRSEVWRVPITGATYGTSSMLITSGPEDETRVTGIVELRHNDLLLHPASPVQMAKDYPDESSGTPKVYAILDDDDVEVMPYPASTDTTFEGRAILTPTLACTEIPDVLYDRHEESICYGILARMFLQPQKTWTNRQLGGDYLSIYNEAIENAKREHRKRNRSAKIVKVKAYGGLLD